MLTILFILFISALLVGSSSLLSVLLIIELMGFLVIFFLAFGLAGSVSGDYLIMTMFSVLVMEGVIGLCGLIGLVSYSGSDYMGLGYFLKV